MRFQEPGRLTNSTQFTYFTMNENATKPVWPLMRNVREKRSVELAPGVRVLIRDDDHRRLSRVAARSVTLPCTVPVVVLAPGLAERPWLEGAHPADGGPVRDCLATIHRYPARATAFEVLSFLDVRRRRAGLPEIADWRGWDELVADPGPWVRWHGDPTLTNCLVTAGGPVMIDHAPDDRGPREYDYAKLRRSELLGDDGVVRGRPDRRDLWLGVVIAGMVGSHEGVMRDLLLDMWRTTYA